MNEPSVVNVPLANASGSMGRIPSCNTRLTQDRPHRRRVAVPANEEIEQKPIATSRTPAVRAITSAVALGSATLIFSMSTPGASSASAPTPRAVIAVMVSSVFRVMGRDCQSRAARSITSAGKGARPRPY